MVSNPYAGNGCGYDGCGYGYTPLVSAANALEVLASVGASTSPTSATTKKISTSFLPKAFIPFGSLMSSAGASTGLNLGFGATNDTVDAAISVSSINGLTTTNTDRRHVGNKCFTIITNGTTTEEASAALFESDGVTLNWSTASATAYILNHIALGGDIEVSITQQQMNNTNAAQSFAHGLTGGSPDAVLFVSSNNNIAPPRTDAECLFSFGGWESSSQFGVGLLSLNGQTTTATRMVMYNNACVIYTSTTIQRTMSVATVDATNVNCEYPVATSAYQSYFWMIAIRGCTAKVGTFDCNGSTNPLTISCTGITPKLFLPVFVYSGVGSINTVQNSLMMSIGASDGTNNVSCGITDQNAQTTTNARRYQSSTSLVQYSVGGSLGFEATATFDGESVILDPTTNSDSSYGEGAYLILGE